MNTQVSYSVNLVGRVWAGYQSSYVYSGFSSIPDAKAVKAKAGDFQSIEDYQVMKHVTQHTQIPNGWRTVNEETVEKQWDSEDSEFVFTEGQA